MPQSWVPNAVAEAIGAFALVFVVVLAVSNTSVFGVAMAAGMAIAVMVAALGHVSGGHFNPAVTFAFLLAGRINGQMAAIYWSAQFIGGIIAAALAGMLVSRDAVAAGATVLGEDVNPFQGILLEAVATFFLVLVIFGTVLDRRAPAGVYPLAIGFTITAGILAIGPLTGGSLNPARSFGPALIGGEWGGIAAWLIGPLAGAALAWAVYAYVIAPQPELVDDRS